MKNKGKLQREISEAFAELGIFWTFTDLSIESGDGYKFCCSAEGGHQIEVTIRETGAVWMHLTVSGIKNEQRTTNNSTKIAIRLAVDAFRAKLQKAG